MGTSTTLPWGRGLDNSLWEELNQIKLIPLFHGVVKKLSSAVMTEPVKSEPVCNHVDQNCNGSFEGLMFSPSKIIRKKRDGGSMTKAEMQWLIGEVSKTEGGSFTDSQIGAWLMAAYLKDLTPEETSWMTEAMLHSGDILHWPPEFRGQLLDKHCTGGVGDKISLALAPALAAFGVKVPMISGRGLGHTGGTLDKLESIPGFRVTGFTEAEMVRILREVGCFIIGQSANLVPADKKLYGVRDITATVKSSALIASSIMSKKAAESLNALILDVKCGKAAFMKDLEASRGLARRMVETGKLLDIETVSLITQMDNPIGNAVGNAIELAEAIQCLQGKSNPDLLELVSSLGGHLLSASGHIESTDAGIEKIKSLLQDGTALEKFQQMVIAQGADPTLAQQLVNLDLTDLDQIWSILPKSENVTDIPATDEGFVESIDALELALVAKELGAGREVEGAPIDHSVGIQLFVTRGSHIQTGDSWIRVYHQSNLLQDHRMRIEGALTLSRTPVTKRSRIMEVIKS